MSNEKLKSDIEPSHEASVETQVEENTVNMDSVENIESKEKPTAHSWTYSAVNRADVSSDEDEYISKTELKNEAKELHSFGKQLVLLSGEKLNLLPLNETTKYAVTDFHKQVGNIAKKRHLAYIAKCLRSDDKVSESMNVLEQDSFAQLRAVAAHKKTKAKEEKLDNQTNFINLLVSNGDNQIQVLIEQYPTMDRQTLRQLVRNLQKAKTESKLLQAKNKILDFVAGYKVDLALFNY